MTSSSFLGLAACYQEYIQILKIHAPIGWGRRLDEFFVVLVRLKSVAIFGPVAILGPKTVVAYFGRFRACFVAHVQLQPAFQFLAVCPSHWPINGADCRGRRLQSKTPFSSGV